MPDRRERTSVFDTPWKLRAELRRIATAPLTHAYLRSHGVRIGQGAKLYGTPLVQRHRGSSITAGTGLVLRSWTGSNPLGGRRCILATWSAEATIDLGEECKATGLVVVSESAVRIGDRVRLGAGCTIVDTDFHPVDPDNRSSDPRRGRSVPVTIGDDVFLGMGTIVLKGVEIGAGTVVSAGSLVAESLPPGVIARGNPAVVVRDVR